MIRLLYMMLAILCLSLPLACQREKEPPPRALSGHDGVLPPLYLTNEKSDSKFLGPAAAEGGAAEAQPDTAVKATETAAEAAPTEDQEVAATTEKQPTGDEQEVQAEESPPAPEPKKPKPKSEIESQMDATPTIPGVLNRG